MSMPIGNAVRLSENRFRTRIKPITVIFSGPQKVDQYRPDQKMKP
jgi:hypothetical protein